MSLATSDVAKVALLARLRLGADELETFTGQLNSIVDYVAQLQESIRPASSLWPMASSSRNVFRDDVRGPALDREAGAGQCPQARPRGLSGARRARVIVHRLRMPIDE